ncbi:MAG: DNA polymerase I [Chloroflexi bacterium]|nr:DNA polymerase I [Chloroflexota bacterium]
MTNNHPLLVLIDGFALAYRAYHALPPTLATSKGELTNAVYGFTSMLLKVLKEEQPEYLAVAMDVGPTFRHQLAPSYKANRPHMADEMSSQVAYINAIIQAFNIPIYSAAGFEADDVLGTLANQAATQNLETLIVTGDTDTFQLIQPGIQVLTSSGRFSDTVTYDTAAIRLRYNLDPLQLIDYRALRGDASDNIPNVPGIGDRTATELLQQFHDVENLLNHLDLVDNSRAFRALAAPGMREQILTSKHLARIVTDVPVTLNLEQCRYGDYDKAALLDLFHTLEFRSLVDRLPNAIEEAPPAMTTATPPEKYTAITDGKSLQDLARRLAAAAAISFDTETTDVDPLKADLVGLALSGAAGEGYYIPVAHDQSAPLSREEIQQALQPVFSNPEITKIAHNAKYDLAVMQLHGIDVQGPIFDTMVAAWLLDPARRIFGLKELVKDWLGTPMTPITELIGKGKQQLTMNQVDIASAVQYAGADADMTFHLAEALRSRLVAQDLWSLFSDLEMPFLRILLEMEMTGILLDLPYLQELSREFYQRMEALESDIFRMAGHPFNINSTKQLATVLFDELGLPKLKRTKTGYSTDAEVLENLRDAHQIFALLLEYRQLGKLKSTYADALPLLADTNTGRVHTSFNQTGAVTGRISSSNPNLQNIPIRSDEGRRLRRAFIVQPGWLLLTADYSQIELRILAHMSQDQNLLDAFHHGQDIHAATAAAIYQVPLAEVTPNMRRTAKTINFGIIYGISGFGLAARTELSQNEANQFINAYFQTYPDIRRFLENIKSQAARQGYISTLMGRRRYFPELSHEKPVPLSMRMAAEREAINMPIQGTAADIVKVAMLRLHRELKNRNLRSRLLLQVHDELVLEAPEDEIQLLIPVVREAMEQAYTLDVPLKVEIGVGPNWGEIEELS